MVLMPKALQKRFGKHWTNMKKRVLLIANEYTTIVNFRMELVSALIRKGHTVSVALPLHERVAEIRALGCEVYSLPIDRKSKNPLKDFMIIRHICKILKAFKPDMVFTFTIKPNVYGGIACALNHVPYVSTITGLGSSIQNGGVMQQFSLLLYRLGLRNAQKVFFQNIANRDVLCNNKIYTGAYEMIPGSGVNLDRFHLMEYPAGEKINFVFVARVMKEKGIEEFFEAVKYIKAKYPQCYFHICGPYEGAYETQLKDLEQRGIVVYHGMVSDMPRIYKFAHCIIHPSYHEGMANVLLESAACGKAIICSNINGCKEAVVDGVNGLLADVKSAESLKRKIEQFVLLSHEEQRSMGLAGRKKMEHEFDRNIVVNKYLKELR